MRGVYLRYMLDTYLICVPLHVSAKVHPLGRVNVDDTRQCHNKRPDRDTRLDWSEVASRPVVLGACGGDARTPREPHSLAYTTTSNRTTLIRTHQLWWRERAQPTRPPAKRASEHACARTAADSPFPLAMVTKPGPSRRSSRVLVPLRFGAAWICPPELFAAGTAPEDDLVPNEPGHSGSRVSENHPERTVRNQADFWNADFWNAPCATTRCRWTVGTVSIRW